MTTLKEAHETWYNDIKPLVVEQFGEDDIPALSESWNNYTDSLCQESSEISPTLYHYCPAYDDDMPEDDIEFLIESLDVTMNANFVPAGMFKGDDWREKSINHNVVLHRRGVMIATPFSQGIGHHPFYRQANHKKLYHAKAMAESIESGAAIDPERTLGHGVRAWAKLPMPDVKDVLHSLLMDTSADFCTFSDWCAEMDYSDDSIIAQSIYNAGLEHKLKIEAMFSAQELDDLRKAFEDY